VRAEDLEPGCRAGVGLVTHQGFSEDSNAAHTDSLAESKRLTTLSGTLTPTLTLTLRITLTLT